MQTILMALLLVNVVSLSNAQKSEIRKVEERLLAPCCYTQSIAVHGSEVADQMRAEVTEMVVQGRTENEITGVMLVVVLLVMVGEEAQEMQVAGWLSTTHVRHLSEMIPDWAGLWFSIFPTVETLVSQLLAAALVFGSYFTARRLPGMAR